MAGKTNATASEIDKTSFYFAGLCAICHPGGGFGEFDRDGYLFYDVNQAKFGYELSNNVPSTISLDGDYGFVSPVSGKAAAAKWDVTGVAEPDCLFCHRADRTVVNPGPQGQNMNWVWRTATLRASAALVDSQQSPVPAFASGSTAGMGWFSSLVLNPNVPAGKPPQATSLDISYQPGITAGVLYANDQNQLTLAGSAIATSPKDYACWGCHVVADTKKRGRYWFDPESDVHYAAFNNLNDSNTKDDVAALDSVACTKCHPADITHHIAKGNAPLGSVTDDWQNVPDDQYPKDYAHLRTCSGCHLANSPDRDPDAPVPTGGLHASATHMKAMSCQFCHIPYRTGIAQLIVDNATTGSSIGYNVDAFLSADPLDPTNQDKSKWWPAFIKKPRGGYADGVDRLGPVKNLLSIWWGDWDVKAKVVSPIALWRVRGVTGGKPLTGVPDDNNGGTPGVNTLAGNAHCQTTLRANDIHGNPVAVNPVLVKGGKVYYADTQAPGGVNSFEYHGTGVHVESSHPFGIDHNVLKANVALGATGCGECHKNINNGQDTPVFDRLILVDPFDLLAKPVYETGREFSGVDPN